MEVMYFVRMSDWYWSLEKVAVACASSVSVAVLTQFAATVNQVLICS